jgi:hypothetical protein
MRQAVYSWFKEHFSSAPQRGNILFLSGATHGPVKRMILTDMAREWVDFGFLVDGGRE